jgi:16S rRNA C967 or C1407 C5-methylase (RsmB/RsmF family)
VSLSLPTERLAAMLPGWFDVVLCDAPCSGEGLFLKRKHSPDAWSHSQVHSAPAASRAFCPTPTACCAPVGLLVYATCTFSREEDEDQAARLLDAGYTPEPFPAVAASPRP